VPLFPVAAVEKLDQIVGLLDRHVDQRDADLDNRQPREHIDDIPRAFRCLLNVVALGHWGEDWRVQEKIGGCRRRLARLLGYRWFGLRECGNGSRPA
jgi:hypothetical protein